MTRDKCAALAAETIQILHQGHYTTPNGGQAFIAGMQGASLASTQLIRPPEWERIVSKSRHQRETCLPTISVTAETTLQAAKRLVVDEQRTTVLALNFASARNPGGGFLNGARAQEESIARSSGLYPTLLKCREYYDANRAHEGTLYTDHAILSHAVPVIRNDAGDLLEEPYSVTILTMPAPNRGAMPKDSHQIPAIPETFRRRIEQICALATHDGNRTLILGAWGCGAFRNDPDMVASIFAEVLDSGWSSCFEQICFAVFDPSSDGHIRAAFEQHLSPKMTKEH